MQRLSNVFGALLFLLLSVMPMQAGAADAQVRYVITNGGVDVKDKAQVRYFQGGHNGTAVTWARSGDIQTLPAGTYDVDLTFSDGAVTKEIWLDNQAFSGKVQKTVELGIKIADVTYLITNGGVDVKDKAQVHFHQGTRDGNNLTWARSGDTSRLPAGTYAVDLTFSDGAATKEIWLDNQVFSGKVAKTVELGVKTTDVTYVITNGGVDVKDKAQVHFHQGTRDGNNLTWARSGDTSRLPEGTYAVDLTFSGGSASKEIWFDNQVFSGTVKKTVEVGVKTADVTYVITNGGVDVKDKGQVHFHQGARDGNNLTWARSGDTSRLPAGIYAVEVTFADGLIHKTIWLDAQNFSGTVQRTIDLKIVEAEPTVTVTENGTDVGDKAAVDYFEPAPSNDIGTTRSAQTALVERGTYDIRATLADAEGWLHNVAISGKPHLTIAAKRTTVETLQANAPAPKACRIEVYGVNFDFNKAVLRPESEPVLKQVLAIFTATPSFSAEVSGHTDNIGTPAYNLKLSDSRADAVKSWLVAHGVAPARVTSRGYGDSQPLVPNTTDANRFKNRRVELRRTNCI